MGHVHDGQLGQVRSQLVELPQGPRLEDALDPIGELAVLQPSLCVVPLERGDDPFTFDVRGTRPLLHGPSIARGTRGGRVCGEPAPTVEPGTLVNPGRRPTRRGSDADALG